MIDFGWLVPQCMYCGWSFPFLNGLYDPAFRFKCTSRKSASGKLMIVVIWRFSSLKHLIRSLRILSSFGPFAFLRILSKNFLLKHRYHKIFNRNTVKISYSCLPNMSSIIKSHNNKVLAISQKIDVAESDASTCKCNCRKSAACPLEGKCLTKSIIYQATISSNNKNSQKFRYIGLTEGTFKSRYNDHLQSIRHEIEKHETATVLSKKYWEIKRGGNEPYIAWKIVKQVDTYEGGHWTAFCNLCLAEKYFIIRDRGINLLNSRTEILSKCRHRKKFLLNRAI